MRRPLIVISIAMTLTFPMLFSACAAKPENPSFPVNFSQASHALAEMRADPKPLQRPLLIIGGFLDVNVSPPLFKSFFQSVTRDSRIITVSVGLCGSFEECRRKTIEAVDEACPSNDPDFTTEVDVVGASLGGLVGRYAAAPSDDPARPRRLKIARLFSISSPHGGATLANLVAVSDYHKDLRPNSAFMNQLAESDATATYELYPYVRLNDELVGAKYAAPPGVNPLWLPNPPLTLAHLGAMIDSRILADISRRLRNEKPFSQFPPTPLPQFAQR